MNEISIEVSTRGAVTDSHSSSNRHATRVDIPPGLAEAEYDSKAKAGSSSVVKGKLLMGAAWAQTRKALHQLPANRVAGAAFQLFLLLLVVALWGLHLHARYQVGGCRGLVG